MYEKKTAKNLYYVKRDKLKNVWHILLTAWHDKVTAGLRNVVFTGNTSTIKHTLGKRLRTFYSVDLYTEGLAGEHKKW